MLFFFFPLTLSVKLNLWRRGPLFLLLNLAPFLLHLFSGHTKKLHANILVCSCSAQHSTYTSPMNTISESWYSWGCSGLWCRRRLFLQVGQQIHVHIVFTLYHSASSPFLILPQMHCWSCMQRSQPAHRNESVHSQLHQKYMGCSSWQNLALSSVGNVC